MALYLIPNGPSPTTAAQVVVTTGTAIKTLLQVQASATMGLKIVEWGISFDGAAAAAGIKVELLEGDVAATVTAHVTAGIVRIDAEAAQGGDPVTNRILVGTEATGYTASAEDTITVSRMFDVQLVQPTNQYVKQFPLGREPYMKPGTFFTRIRVTAAAAVNAYCYIIVEA
jgi:hypothetical protein